MNTNSYRNAARWSARVLGALFLAIVVLFVVAHAVSGELPRFWQEPFGIQLEVAALILMAIGGVVGWISPPSAALMTLGGYVLWNLVERRLPWPPGFIDVPLLVGLLYAFASWPMTRLSTTRRHAE
jgi:ABC-type branched-subunit amino acid transport system permease subunit